MLQMRKTKMMVVMLVDSVFNALNSDLILMVI
jgi:hypothetical protein